MSEELKACPMCGREPQRIRGNQGSYLLHHCEFEPMRTELRGKDRRKRWESLVSGSFTDELGRPFSFVGRRDRGAVEVRFEDGHTELIFANRLKLITAERSQP